jgi:putative thioredoxin
VASGSGILEVSDATFYQQVLVRSHELPVVVDFWAPWCGPCRQLAPILERIAASAAGRFAVAKLNIDESPAVARQYGVQSIPLVVAFREGQPVDQFLGLQPEAAVREFVARLEPSAADRLVSEAAKLAEQGEKASAEVKYRAALEAEPRHARALLELARLLGARGELEPAQALLARVVPGSPVEAEVDRLSAELRMRAHGSADEGALRQRIASDSADFAARLELGRALAASQRVEEGLQLLLEVVRGSAAHVDDARKAILDVFELLGPRHALTQQYRKQLAQALFR